MFKLKNWIIKKLGGYTKIEYTNLCDLAFSFGCSSQKLSVIPVRAHDILDDCKNDGALELRKQLLADRVARHVKDYVFFRHKKTFYCNSIILEASVWVVSKEA